MRKSILTLLAITTFGFITAQESEKPQPRIGIKGGMNIATMTGKDSSGAENRISIHAGLFVEFKINEKFSIQPEAFYSGKGLTAKVYDDSGYYIDATFRINYIDIPVMFKYYVADNFSLEAGPYVGILVAAKIAANSSNGSGSADIKELFKSMDYGLAFGANYDINNNLFVNFRYSAGLQEAGNTGGGDDIKHSVIQFGLGYKFKNKSISN